MPEKGEPRIDSCVECKTKQSDPSEKEVFQCKLCERWFCEKHLPPRFVMIPDFGRVQDRKFQELCEFERRREDGHPDIAYTQKWYERHSGDTEGTEMSAEQREADRQRRINKLVAEGLRLPSQPTSLNPPAEEAQSVSPSPESKTDSQPHVEEDLSRAKAEENRPTRNYEPPETEYERKQRKRKPFPVKKIIGILLVAIILGCFFWFSPDIISIIQSFFSKPFSSPSQANSTRTYTKVTVPEQMTTIKLGTGEYSFLYIGLSATFSVSASSSASRMFSAVKGKIHQVLGLEMVVSEVHTDNIVLSVKTIPARHYNLGEEIRDYPADVLAVTFTYWKTTSQSPEPGYWFDAEGNDTLVISNYTLRNIADSEISFFTSSASFYEMPLLKYGSYYASAISSSTALWLGCLLTGEPHSSLMPNQTTRGVLAYEILKGYEPVRLIYPNKDALEFTVEISQSAFSQRIERPVLTQIVSGCGLACFASETVSIPIHDILE